MENGANGVPMVLVPYHAEVEPKQEDEPVITQNHLEVEIPVLVALHRQLPVTTRSVQASYPFLKFYFNFCFSKYFKFEVNFRQ